MNSKRGSGYAAAATDNNHFRISLHPSELTQPAEQQRRSNLKVVADANYWGYAVTGSADAVVVAVPTNVVIN